MRIEDLFDALYEFYGPQGWWPSDEPFEMMVGAILTQNTAWSNVEKAVSNLKKAKALSSPRALHELDLRRLALMIKPSGYYNIKAARLKNLTAFLLKRYGGSIRKASRRKTGLLRAELLAVSGIGPETCDSILLYAFNRTVFVIDAYTKRVFSRHRFFKKDISYQDAQDFFTERLRKDARLFNEFHALIVRLAKDFCRTKPHCRACPLKGVKAQSEACRSIKLLANRSTR